MGHVEPWPPGPPTIHGRIQWWAVSVSKPLMVRGAAPLLFAMTNGCVQDIAQTRMALSAESRLPKVGRLWASIASTVLTPSSGKLAAVMSMSARMATSTRRTLMAAAGRSGITVDGATQMFPRQALTHQRGLRQHRDHPPRKQRALHSPTPSLLLVQRNRPRAPQRSLPPGPQRNQQADLAAAVAVATRAANPHPPSSTATPTHACVPAATRGRVPALLIHASAVVPPAFEDVVDIQNHPFT